MAEDRPIDPKDPEHIADMGRDGELARVAIDFMERSAAYRYEYNFTWLGRPIIQYPQDVVAMQEIIWKTRPDFIVETGIAHGGSLIFSASILELCGGDGRVLGVDIDIRQHNRVEIERHPMSKRIDTIEGSSIDPAIVERVKRAAQGRGRVMVVLDSNHTHDHVLSELRAYAPLVSEGCYLIACDTGIEDMPDDLSADRPWNRTNNPMTAVRAFLAERSDFAGDEEYAAKLLITASGGGYLRRVAPEKPAGP